jgi:adenylosuccinate synthase
MNKINNVDIVCGLAWGDEAKGKIVASLLKENNYDWVCRWCGSHNAGHTIYFDNKKFVTHIVPAGVFFGIKSFIGPDCLININELVEELNYLKNEGIDTSQVFISSRAHVILDTHREEDRAKYKNTQGSTGKGVAPCSRDKFGRVGQRICDLNQEEISKLFEFNKNMISDISILNGNILCEGAQGNWLDINYGNYPYVTSALTLPYSACSLGFSPKKIRDIYGAAKIYDTRVGIDPDFSDDLLNNEDLTKIAEIGNEFGATTGRSRKVNWLNLDKLITSINISGCNKVIMSKTDVLESHKKFKLYFKNKLFEFKNLDSMMLLIKDKISSECEEFEDISFSNNPYDI